MISPKLYNKFFFLLTFFISITYLYSQKKFTLVLDAGHGGSDIGANRNYADIGSVQEKNVTLGIVLKLGRMLEKNKDYKVIYTRKIDEYPSLTSRTDLANRSKADLFISVHVNSSPSKSATAQGTETFVQGPNQNRANLDVAKAENDVIFLDERDKENFASYNPSSPESLIALKIQQSKYLEASLIIGGMVEDNFVKKDKRLSRGVKQENLHVLRMNAMPSILIETGFVNNYDDAHYISTEEGQHAIAESIFNAIVSYKKLVDRNVKEPEPEKPVEQPLKNDFRILLMSTPNKYNDQDPALKGLKYILPIKENGFYKYYYGTTNYASVKDTNLKTAKDAGFRNSIAISFVPNQSLGMGYYTLEIYSGKDKLDSKSKILKTIPDIIRNKENGIFYYTFGKYKTLEDAIKAQKDFEGKGITNTIIEKRLK
ncbi:N-acetylmuramoyl-L-alanine amidase [Epilithonimonas ginsengisoli]|uniref:N-acetylmuramoyl-L-alanine amidase n=1 Tax=Epilithonimonas ginsengisoli TaxID=1245592 RepID=A0ABU4JI42_9FLAO|nr:MULTISPECIES: N-acetylmuramoyl-L-alanine amidase [Chryseobacterium group]MBV6879910.1 N-acetylmuramoyl-L-alanine amidase [Epilithonimonas sp. FP105]MDW8549355.1 N-acetylmuramoyl-L-alanine amidase [Epilithonimonas ginsengisoli]OAH70241.1 cell wall hydrolase [Chryseobacterium sp. FP211-J200]